MTILEQMKRITTKESNPYASLQAVKEHLYDFAEKTDDSPMNLSFNVEVKKK